MQSYLDVAVNAAKQAGEILRQGSLRSLNSDADAANSHDIKLHADVESERLIRSILQAQTGLPVVGEELGGDPSLTTQDCLYWVVDPLDGTHNYLRQVPICGVSIGLMRAMEPVLGVFYDFNCDECFTSIVEEQCICLNGRRITPQWAKSIDQASLHTGFPVAMDYSSEGLQRFIGKVQRFKKVRAIGSASAALAWVACGRFDAYYEEGSRLWDIAAGIALIKGAGGYIRMTPSPLGKPLAYDVWGTACEGFAIDS
ncbi:MAG: hypothetical protein JW739_03495 [Opitutales bacterium]|nr:hypothetical protein [Opitutales bacterium]